MIDDDYCKKIFKDENLASIIASYDVSSLAEIKELRIHPGVSGVYDAVHGYDLYCSIKSLEGLEHLTGLEVLEVLDCHRGDFRLTPQLQQQLKVFRIHDCGPYHRLASNSDLVEDMHNLEELTWVVDSVCDLSQILKLKKLKRLFLYCYEVEDLSDLQLLPSNIELDLSVVNKLDSYISIGDCNLIRLTVEAKAKIDLAKYPNLQQISLQRCELENFKLIESACKLNWIWLQNCGEVDVAQIANSDKLEELYVKETKFKSGSLLVENLPNLRGCGIRGTNLRKISLGNLDALNYINLEDNELEEVLFTAVSIKDLYLNNNKLKDIDFLATMVDSLERISLNNNPLNDLSILSTCINLKSLNLSNACNAGKLKALYSMSNIYLDLSGDEHLSASELTYLVEQCDFTIKCDAKYLQIVDPLNAIKDLEFKKRLGQCLYSDSCIIEEYRYQHFIYTSIFSDVKELGGSDHIALRKPELGELNIGANINNLEGIEIFTNLETINLWFKNNTISLKPLAELKNLQHIKFTNACLVDTSTLLEIKSLRSCRFIGCTCMSENELSTLERLNKLGVSVRADTMESVRSRVPDDMRQYMSVDEIVELGSLW